jgi:hypothetical protein
MGDGRWEMGDGRWEMGDGRWEMGDGRWRMGTSNVELSTFNFELGKTNGKGREMEKRRRLVAVLVTTGQLATCNLQPATQN